MNTIFYKSRQEDLAFINPTDVTKPVEHFPEICISTFSKQIIDKFAAMEGVERIVELYSANGVNPVYKIRYGGREIAFYLSLVGAPACACGLEEMIAMGGRKFVFFGCCGVLDEPKVGDRFIIPTGTVRDEGTSYHYLAPEEELEPDQEVTSTVKRCLETHGYPSVSGKIWTTDAIYRETREAIMEYKEMGCLGVDMEYSALLAVAKYRGLKLGQFFYGADNLDSQIWEPRDLTDYGFTNAEKYMLLAFECGLAL